MDIKDSYNLVVCGDSISKGVVYDSDRSKYSAIKDCFVNLVGNSIKGTVYNAGRFGSTIMRGVSKMYNDVMKKSPDIVLIEFGGNDCDFNWEDVAQNPEVEHKPNTDISIFHTTLLNMIDTLKKENITPILMNLPPLDPMKYFKWVTKGNPFAEKNVLYWLGSVKTIYDWHKLYSEMIERTAKETKTVLIDVRSEFLKHEDYSNYLCVDGIHPNTQGHNLIANTLLNFIKQNYSFLLR